MKLYYVVLLSFFVTTAQAQLLTEDFSAIPIGNFTGNGWSQCSATTTSAQIGTNNLSYLNYITSNTTNALQTAIPAGASNLGGYCKSFTNPGATNIYAAFLLKVDQISWTGTSGQYFFTLGNSNIDNAAAVFFKRTSPTTFQLGARKGTGLDIYAPTTLNTGTTYLVVLKYSKVAGAANDIVSLFINPTVGAPEPAASVNGNIGDPDVSTTIQNVFIRLNQLSSQIPPVTIDAINVDSTWSGVLTPGLSPNCNAQASFTLVTNGLTVLYSNTSTGTHTGVTWNFGDGNIGTNFTSQSNTYSAPGTYNACLYVYNNNTLCDSTCQTVTVNWPASISDYTTQECSMGCNGMNVILNSKGNTKGSLLVYNMEGRIVYQQAQITQAGTTSLTLPKLATGIYLVRWVSNKGIVSTKTQF